MMKMKWMWSAAGLAACVSLLSVTAVAAEQSKAKPSPVKAAAVKARVPVAWPSETLSGKISMVKPADKLLIVTASNGVPFDLRVTPATRIRSGSQPISMSTLKSDKQKSVTVRFTPEASGDIARSIQIQS